MYQVYTEQNVSVYLTIQNIAYAVYRHLNKEMISNRGSTTKNTKRIQARHRFLRENAEYNFCNIHYDEFFKSTDLRISTFGNGNERLEKVF